MRVNFRQGCTPLKKSAFPLFFYLCTQLMVPCVLLGATSVLLENGNTAAGQAFRQPMAIVQAEIVQTALESFNFNATDQFRAEIRRNGKICKVIPSDAIGGLPTHGPGVTYGPCMRFRSNNQQFFLRLDLPPPDCLHFE